MKTLSQFVEGMTDPAYRKNPKRYQEIEDQTKKLAEDVIKTMEDYCENDKQKQDFFDALLREIWFETSEMDRKNNLLPIIKNFIDQE
ncbi:MAG: hypothetical protein J1F35_08095 [Erysipelotrichales bacterium]|nr:hypothetical protein [Erysipelotrichales bacterium]